MTRLDGPNGAGGAVFLCTLQWAIATSQHVLLPGDESKGIDNAHAIFEKSSGLHQLNSVFLPGTLPRTTYRWGAHTHAFEGLNLRKRRDSCMRTMLHPCVTL